tara:strand:- start:1498 stop:1752 length:255 start_codon:yes stop_codon:yes gene_type:complete
VCLLLQIFFCNPPQLAPAKALFSARFGRIKIAISADFCNNKWFSEHRIEHRNVDKWSPCKSSENLVKSSVLTPKALFEHKDFNN